MSKMAKNIVILLAAALISGPAFGAISFSDDFESYPVYEGGLSDIGGGWVFYVNVFGNYPGCSDKWYDYGGPYPAPNGPQISNIVAGSTGNALNKFSDYNNGDHGNGACIETNVFQERAVTSEDFGLYVFRFETQVPMELGVDVNTFGFIKLLNPATGYSLDKYETVSTETAGAKFVKIRLDPSDEGKILQWGFTTTASNYEPSGRYYDNVTFALQGTGAYDGDLIGVPVPFWAYLVIGGLLAYFGASRLRSKKQA